MIFIIHGTLLNGKQFKRYVEARGELEATNKVMESLENVGSWMVDVSEEDPEGSTIECPHCGEQVRNPAVWV